MSKKKPETYIQKHSGTIMATVIGSIIITCLGFILNSFAHADDILKKDIDSKVSIEMLNLTLQQNQQLLNYLKEQFNQQKEQFGEQNKKIEELIAEVKEIKDRKVNLKTANNIPNQTRMDYSDFANRSSNETTVSKGE